MTLHYRVVTVAGDQFLCAAECPKRITLPALMVRYVETGEWESLGEVPRFDISVKEECS